MEISISYFFSESLWTKHKLRDYHSILKMMPSQGYVAIHLQIMQLGYKI